MRPYKGIEIAVAMWQLVSTPSPFERGVHSLSLPQGEGSVHSLSLWERVGVRAGIEMNAIITAWLDILLVVLLVSSITFGFHQGLIRQLVLLVATYISTILAAQYYRLLSNVILQVFPSSVTEVADLVAFVALAVLFTAVATWMLWTAYCETHLPSVIMLDELGGAVLGGIIGVFAISLMLVLARYSLQAPWPEGSPFKYILQTGMLNSMLQPAFSSPLPLVQATLRPWLPFGIPTVLGS